MALALSLLGPLLADLLPGPAGPSAGPGGVSGRLAAGVAVLAGVLAVYSCALVAVGAGVAALLFGLHA